MPKFEKGKSGNPGGRPKTGELRELCRSYTEEAVKKLGKLINSQSPRIAIMAIRELLDRGYGKPLQALEVALDDARPNADPAYSGPMLPEQVAKEIAKLISSAEQSLGLVPLPQEATNEERIVRLRQHPEGLPPNLYAALYAFGPGTVH